MNSGRCPGCQRGLPIYLGHHCGELEYIPCTAGLKVTTSKLELVPIEQPDQPARDAWIRDDERRTKGVPFVCEGAA